jgi:hypothetical protein
MDQNRIVGFPIAWTPSHYAAIVAEVQEVSSPLQFILRVGGFTLNEVINDHRLFRWIHQAYKGYCEVKRGELRNERALWVAYLLWLKRQGCPFDWDANVGGPDGVYNSARYQV